MTETPDASSPHAIVVDDDAVSLIAACGMLEDAGFAPLEATTADEALQLLQEHAGTVQLLFTDVQMPGNRNGFALARETATRWPHVSILVASGNTMPQPGDMPAEAIFIDKPFSAEMVYKQLMELLPEGQKPQPLRAK